MNKLIYCFILALFIPSYGLCEAKLRADVSFPDVEVSPGEKFKATYILTNLTSTPLTLTVTMYCPELLWESDQQWVSPKPEVPCKANPSTELTIDGDKSSSGSIQLSIAKNAKGGVKKFRLRFTTLYSKIQTDWSKELVVKIK